MPLEKLKFENEEEKNTLEEKIGECLGLEKAAQNAVTHLTSKGLLKEDAIKRKLFGMRQEAKGHEEKMTKMLGWLRQSAGLNINKIKEKGEETQEKVEEMMKTYLGKDPDTQEALEFLCLAEGGEVTHYEVLSSLSSKIKDRKFSSLVRDILFQEKKHLRLCTEMAKENVREE